MSLSPPTAPEGVISLINDRLTAWVLPYGARLMQLFYDDQPLSLGFAQPEDYAHDTQSIGAVCGRYGNRIEGAVLHRGTETFRLDANEGQQCLHGGHAAFGARLWRVYATDSNSVTLTLDSADGDGGWPGQCIAFVRYRVSDDVLTFEAWAEVSRACPLNLIQHTYWNLGGPAAVHELTLNAPLFLPSDSRNLPTVPTPVVDTAFDFTQPRAIGDNSYDHAFLVEGEGLRWVADLKGPWGQATFYSDQPSVQLYTAGGLSEQAPPLGFVHSSGNAVCLETQQPPNGPTLGYPVWVEPGSLYRHTLKIHFRPQTP